MTAPHICKLFKDRSRRRTHASVATKTNGQKQALHLSNSLIKIMLLFINMIAS